MKTHVKWGLASLIIAGLTFYSLFFEAETIHEAQLISLGIAIGIAFGITFIFTILTDEKSGWSIKREEQR